MPREVVRAVLLARRRVETPRRILLANGDPSLRDTIADLLDASGYAVVAVHTPNALERALVDSGEPRFDLLLVDLTLSERMLETLDRLGRAGVRPTTVGLLPHEDEATRIESYRIGCVCTIGLPLDVKELLDTVTVLAAP